MKRNLFFAFILLPFILKAQSGTLDKSFADSGILLDLNYPGIINKIGLQSDGKIIAAGAGGSDLSSFFLFARYNTDGTLDSSFGSNGVAGNYNELDQVLALSILPDDALLAMAHPSYKVGLAKYKKNGELDSSFGNNGIVITSVSQNANSASDMVVQPDGKIVVCGYIINAPNEARQLFLVRYLPGGSLDNNFGDGGIVILVDIYGDESLATVNALALQKNGQIVVSLSDAKSTVYRFNTDGSLDKTFGNNGSAYFQSTDDAVKGLNTVMLVVQPDDKIIGCGNGLLKKDASEYYMAASRLNADGSIDSSFGNNGIQHVIFGGQTSDCRSMVLQSDGKIILAGRALGTMAMTRLNANGTIDSGFGENGQVILTGVEGSGASNSVALQKDNKIILGGYTYTGVPVTGYLLLARYNNDLTKKQIIIAKIRRWIQHHNGIIWDNISNVKNYSVQRSGDGAHWSTVYNTINHSQLSINNYYNDPSPLPGTNYYRLQTTSKDGAVQYSNILAITSNDAIKISPNPAKNILHIEGLSSKAKISVISFNGFTAISQRLMANGSYNLNIASLQPGNYLLKIEMNGAVVTKKFLKE
ncbi:MAG: T9SS type A sorting domain-containing protein [Bacteroidetes bacterium]|nr:T9SS type A sorting domain-containing protein [Bacteroidota bacterium]